MNEIRIFSIAFKFGRLLNYFLQLRNYKQTRYFKNPSLCTVLLLTRRTAPWLAGWMTSSKTTLSITPVCCSELVLKYMDVWGIEGNKGGDNQKIIRWFFCHLIKPHLEFALKFFFYFLDFSLIFLNRMKKSKYVLCEIISNFSAWFFYNLEI